MGIVISWMEIPTVRLKGKQREGACAIVVQKAQTEKSSITLPNWANTN